MNIIQVKIYHAPCGTLLLGSFEDKLCLCDWQNDNRRCTIDKRIQNYLHARYEETSSEVIIRAMAQLNEYFAGKRTQFDVPLLFAGTEFQQSVWRELLNIPYGSTLSYAQLAIRIGNPKAIRAVAASNKANALSIFVPCHRVIGSSSKLVGYAGGLAAKRLLLTLESNTELFR